MIIQQSIDEKIQMSSDEKNLLPSIDTNILRAASGTDNLSDSSLNIVSKSLVQSPYSMINQEGKQIIQITYNHIHVNNPTIDSPKRCC